MRKCTVTNCNRKLTSNLGFCAMHFKRWIRNGTTDSLYCRSPKGTICVTLYCTNVGPLIRGYCDSCYRMLLKRGNTDRQKAPNGCGNSRGYRYITAGGVKQLEHRQVMSVSLKRELTVFEVVHHIDGNKLNNDLYNLQLFSSQSDHMKHHHKEKS